MRSGGYGATQNDVAPSRATTAEGMKMLPWREAGPGDWIEEIV